MRFLFFFFNDTATTEIYPLSLHDALPISWPIPSSSRGGARSARACWRRTASRTRSASSRPPRSTAWTSCCQRMWRSEEHTSELQSRQYLVCRLLLEKKNKHDAFRRIPSVL